MLLVEPGRPEQHDDEDDDEDSQKDKLCPKVKDAEKGEIDRDAVEEGGNDAGGTDQPGSWVIGILGARSDGLVVVAAIRQLVAVVEGPVTERLRSESGVLRSYHHGNGIV